ncbi:CDP-glucose 4,6-dehydratase [Spartinivicinus poritis]|uniref:CDP-glucose 4,6-dehydratase n=1 Tax=Spartinivicinus poritis TaxID=2994640 RepID=A0ABT5U8E1_9GAMM|nr:CDP-glucose 4,6-dehydratase [Spartinivicinus sp. A2-2]MDE1462271.1 CDP-glucose 4,6-dehydratase [Spartinivicinus sp. A2-2]
MEIMVDKAFWNGKKVLITGHTGFKGSWLTVWLKHYGAEIIGVSLGIPTTPSFYEKAKLDDGIVNIFADIRDTQKIKDIFSEFKPEIVFHLAAQSIVRRSYIDPVDTYGTNVMGTLSVLEGIRCINTVRSAIMVTTDKCYENQEWAWGYREIDQLGGYDPYSSSKGAAELLISSYRNSFFPKTQYDSHQTGIASVRAGNVIGGGDWAEDRLIPDIICSLRKNRDIILRNPYAIRPWQHVLEPLSGYLLLAEKLFTEGNDFSEAWNFGPRDQEAKEVQWIVEAMVKIWDERITWSIDADNQPHEAFYLKLDCSKAFSKLGWEPQWKLFDAIKKTVEWYQVEVEDGDLNSITLQQINDYINL